MPQHKCSTALSVLALFSILPAAILICGYFTRAGPRLTEVRLTPVARVRSISAELDDGRIRIYTATLTPPPAGAVAGRTIQWSAEWGWPNIKRSLWEFDSHSLTVVPSNGPTVYIVAFPIWCVLTPCLVAPIWWLLRRKRTAFQPGFPMQTSATPA